MNFKKISILFLCTILTLTGCGSSETSSEENVSSKSTAQTTTEEGHATISTVNLTEGKYSDEKLDASWNETSAVQISLGNTIETSDEKSVSAEDSIVTIKQAGTYIVSGELPNGQLIVNVPNKGDVKLVLNNASVASSDSSALYVKEGNTIVVLADGTENTFIDSQVYSFEEGEDEPDATIFAKDDLTFNGTGKLIVKSSYKDAIKCKDDLKFVSGSYEITAADNAIVGKDSVSIKDGSFTITSESDAIKSTNTEETDKGYVMIDGGKISITSNGDGIVAETLLRVNSGTLDIVTGTLPETSSGSEMGDMSFGPGGGFGGGRPDRKNRPEGGGSDRNFRPDEGSSENSSDETPSTKGLKSYVELIAAGGTFTISSEDDAVHSNQNVTIENGNFTIATGDDGIHAEKLLTINNGNIKVTQSYEGLEAFDIIINDGEINLVSSDDGINAAGDEDSAENPEDDDTSSEDTKTTDNFNDFRGFGGMMAEEDQGATLTINGGNIHLLANGDVIDINGDGVVNDGTVIAQGPTMGGNGTLDYASSFDIKGGTFWGIGSSQMAMNPSSSVYGMICGTVQETIAEGIKITVADSSGNVVAELETKVSGQWIAVTAPEIEKGSEYTITIGEAIYSATAN